MTTWIDLASLAEMRLRAVLTVGAAAAEIRGDVRTLAGTIVTELAGFAGGEAALCLLVQASEPVCASAGDPPPGARSLLDEIREAVDDAGIAALMESGLPLVTARYARGGLALLPVTARGDLIGVLGFARINGSAYPDDDLDLGRALASIAALSAENARLVADSSAVLEELRRQSELVDHVSDAIIGVDAEYRIESWNTSAERIYGYTQGEALGCDLLALLATQFCAADAEPLDHDQVLAVIATSGGWRGELRERRADGAQTQTLSAITAVTDATGGFTGAVMVNRDITQERHKEHLATHDTLTGLPNRAAMMSHLHRSIAHASQTGNRIAVVFLDLNGFKEINDTLGHDAGDEVLRVTSRRLSKAVRSRDLVARLGGDEFVVVADDVGGEGANFLALRLVAATSEPIQLGEHVRTCLASIGVAVSGAGNDHPDELLRAADEAMYTAKRQKSGVAFAS